jgi:hypothetical protein
MHRIFFPLAALIVGLLLTVAPAHAYTPENGVWWNPNEPGSGLQIEIQDNYVAVFVYAYDQAGNAQWYTSNGFLTGNARYDGWLDRFTGGQTIGGPWRQNSYFPRAGGPIRIDFDPDDPTRAQLSWGGRSFPIERFHFYLKRDEDEQRMPGVRLELTKMLGEWSAVLDYATHPSALVRYYGEIVILDSLTFDNDGDYVDGCRAPDSQLGFCRDVDIDNHYAAIEYVPSTGEHVLVVENSDTTFAAYFISVGTNEFRGEVSVYTRGTNPSVYYPVRGFRTASRSFVEEGVGPSKASAADAAIAAAGPLPLTEAADGAVATKQLDATMVSTLRMLEARLQRGKSTGEAASRR